MPSQLLNFSKYLKKDQNVDQTAKNTTGQDPSIITNEQTEGQPQNISSVQPVAYSGIGNPPSGMAYSGIGRPSVSSGNNTNNPQTVINQQNTQNQNLPPINQNQTGKIADSKDNKNNNGGSIDMSKRVGMDILSRLTQRSNAVLMQAVVKAKATKQSLVDTEFVLFGLLQDSSVYQLISECKIVPSEITKEIEKNIKPGNFTGQPHFSPRVKRVLELSLVSARKEGYDFISPEHILLALAQEGEGLAARILAGFNLKSDVLSKKILGKKDDEATAEEKKKTSCLEQYAEDLTAKAALGELDPVVGRSWEIERIIHILSRRSKNNPCLIGDAGVGKTAIVEGLAQKIARNEVPETLLNKRILSLDLMSLIAGARHRGEFEERLKNLIKEVKATSGAVILFIDELHNMVGAGSGGEGTMDASNILKPSLARGELQTIGTTTITEYRKYIEKDPALERRFQPVLVAEPTADIAIHMVSSLKDKYEAFHRVKIADDAIEAAVKLSQRYISDRFLPDKAVDLIDEAAASVRLPSISLPEEIKTGEEKLKKLNAEFLEAQKVNPSAASSLSYEIKETEDSLKQLKDQYQIKKSTTTNSVDANIIADIVSRWTNIPVQKLTEKETEKLINLEDVIHKRLINQEDAVKAVSEAVRRGRVGLKSNKRPIGSFIFMGPTGVGKTELAKALAEILFGSEEMMVRLDMTEYMEKHEVAKLIGAPPGYVGYEEGGQLTEAVRRRPYSVVLLDEVEKAHPDVFNILIQLLDDGRLTDNKGHTISFKNTIVICTSNLGSGIIQDEMLKGKEDFKIVDKKKPKFSYAVSPTGRILVFCQNHVYSKNPSEPEWKDILLNDYFIGTTIKEGIGDFPVDDIDSHLVKSDGSEIITAKDVLFFRPATTSKEWKVSKLLTFFKGHTVINAKPDLPEDQLPTVRFDTYAVSAQGVETVSFEDRFWTRDNQQSKSWRVGLLADYFKNGTVTDLPDKKLVNPDQKETNIQLQNNTSEMKTVPNISFPVKSWQAHFFRPTGEEVIISDDYYWTRKDMLNQVWTRDKIENLTEGIPFAKSNKEQKQDQGRKETLARINDKLMDELRKFFRPELINRFDEVVVFSPLNAEHMQSIVELQVKSLAKLLREQNVTITITDNAKVYLGKAGYDPVFGARPLRRAIQKLVENEISNILIKGELTSGGTVIVDYSGEKLTFSVTKPEKPIKATEVNKPDDKTTAQSLNKTEQISQATMQDLNAETHTVIGEMQSQNTQTETKQNPNEESHDVQSSGKTQDTSSPLSSFFTTDEAVTPVGSLPSQQTYTAVQTVKTTAS
jgi:ATP-dependent Clp protease ATP-binding subunit ClpC